MKKTLTKILKVNVCDEYTTEPTHAVVRLTRKDAIRILVLAAAVRRLKVYCIEEFDYTPELKVSDGEYEIPRMKNLKDYDGATDASCLHVTSDSVNWESYIKHTDIAVSTDHIPLKVIRKFFGWNK